MSDDTTGTYTAEFLDGPLEGNFEQRALVDGKPETRIGEVAAIDGLESLFWYNAVEQREVNGGLRVQFRFDPSDSDPQEYDQDDNE
jgi:hypothetical protein